MFQQCLPDPIKESSLVEKVLNHISCSINSQDIACASCFRQTLFVFLICIILSRRRIFNNSHEEAKQTVSTATFPSAQILAHE